MPAESVGGHRPPYINCLLVLGLVHRVDTVPQFLCCLACLVCEAAHFLKAGVVQRGSGLVPLCSCAETKRFLSCLVTYPPAHLPGTLLLITSERQGKFPILHRKKRMKPCDRIEDMIGTLKV